MAKYSVDICLSITLILIVVILLYYDYYSTTNEDLRYLLKMYKRAYNKALKIIEIQNKEIERLRKKND